MSGWMDEHFQREISWYQVEKMLSDVPYLYNNNTARLEIQLHKIM